MQREENAATTEGQKKLPQAGEWWRRRDGKMAYVAAVMPDWYVGEYPVVAASGPDSSDGEEYARMGEYHVGGLISGHDLVEHLPDCTGWDWVPEVWPKWYVHRGADQDWYMRQDDSTTMCLVQWSGESYGEWGLTQSGHVRRGEWIEVTESEAKARLTPPETWPKYVIHAQGFACDTAYLRRDSATDTVSVRKNGYEYKTYWDSDRDECIERGVWGYVTEAEAKARLTSPISNCPDCGQFRGHGHADVCPMAWVTQDRVAPRCMFDQVRWTRWPDNRWVDAAHNWKLPEMHGFRDEEDDTILSVRCRRKDLPLPLPVPAPAKTKIPLRAWVPIPIAGDAEYWSPMIFVTRDGARVGSDYAEVHGLNLYIEDPSASGSVDAAEED